MSEQAQTITIDGVQHELAKFSTEVQKLVGIHQNWEHKVVEARLEVARSEAAVRDLARELIAKIQAELSAASAAVVEEVVAEVVGTVE
jgi:hypothetical protein